MLFSFRGYNFSGRGGAGGEGDSLLGNFQISIFLVKMSCVFGVFYYLCGMKSKPFLQWIGGKTQLLPTLFQMLPKEIEQMEYAEPFVGGVRCCLHFWAVIYG